MGWWGSRSAAAKQSSDLESGGGGDWLLAPGLGDGENQLRWGFIRKVYAIVAAELVLTTVVSGFTVLYAPLNRALLGSTWLALLFAILPLLLLCPLIVYQHKHPWNFVLLALFVITISPPVGVLCANTQGKIVLEALVLTSVVVLSLTAYTFWASRNGRDFNFMGPFLSASLMMLLVLSFIQIFFAPGPILYSIYCGLGALVFAGYIVYDTDNLIKRFTYDDYILASLNLYLDILNLFVIILDLLKIFQSD